MVSPRPRDLIQPAVLHASKPYTRRDWRLELFTNRFRRRRFRHMLRRDFEAMLYGNNPVFKALYDAQIGSR